MLIFSILSITLLLFVFTLTLRHGQPSFIEGEGPSSTSRILDSNDSCIWSPRVLNDVEPEGFPMLLGALELGVRHADTPIK